MKNPSRQPAVCAAGAEVPWACAGAATPMMRATRLSLKAFTRIADADADAVF
jgi:hypothetical protein